MTVVLNRVFDHKTHAWLSLSGRAPIAAEVLDPVLRPHATGADLLVVQAAAERADDARADNESEDRP